MEIVKNIRKNLNIIIEAAMVILIFRFVNSYVVEHPMISAVIIFCQIGIWGLIIKSIFNPFKDDNDEPLPLFKSGIIITFKELSWAKRFLVVSIFTVLYYLIKNSA